MHRLLWTLYATALAGPSLRHTVLLSEAALRSVTGHESAVLSAMSEARRAHKGTLGAENPCKFHARRGFSPSNRHQTGQISVDDSQAAASEASAAQRMETVAECLDLG